jgi:hypothetical protein
MAIQKAEEFRVAMFGAINARYGDTEQKALILIRARDKAIIERCKEKIRKYEHCSGCPASNDTSLLLDSILRDLD